MPDGKQLRSITDVLNNPTKRRTNIPARNMGIHGGKEMGLALNIAMTYAWREYRQDCKWAKENPGSMTDNWKAASERRLKTLCGIRKIGRLGFKEWE
jgi:hypothetical protein